MIDLFSFFFTRMNILMNSWQETMISLTITIAENAHVETAIAVQLFHYTGEVNDSLKGMLR